MLEELLKDCSLLWPFGVPLTVPDEDMTPEVLGGHRASDYEMRRGVHARKEL